MTDVQILAVCLCGLAGMCIALVWRIYKLETRVRENEDVIARSVQVLYQRTATLMHESRAERLHKIETIVCEHDRDLQSAARLFVTHAQAIEILRRERQGGARGARPVVS